MEDELEQLDAKTNQKLVRTCLYYMYNIVSLNMTIRPINEDIICSSRRIHDDIMRGSRIFFQGGGVQRLLEFDGEGGSEAYIL